MSGARTTRSGAATSAGSEELRPQPPLPRSGESRLKGVVHGGAQEVDLEGRKGCSEHRTNPAAPRWEAARRREGRGVRRDGAHAGYGADEAEEDAYEPKRGHGLGRIGGKSGFRCSVQR